MMREWTLARRPQLIVASAFAAFAACALVVLKLASEIGEGEFLALDRAMLVWIRQHLGGNAALRATMLDLTALGDVATLTIVVAIAGGLFVALGQRRLALLIIVQALLASALVQGIKGWIGRARPNVVEHWAPFSAASFPSGHTALSAIVYLTLAVLSAERLPNRASRLFLMIAAMLLVVAIGFSRLYLGVHWPTDVLAGWMLGGGWATLCWTLFRSVRRQAI